MTKIRSIARKIFGVVQPQQAIWCKKQGLDRHPYTFDELTKLQKHTWYLVASWHLAQLGKFKLKNQKLKLPRNADIILLNECNDFINWLFTHGGAWSPDEDSNEYNIRYTVAEAIYRSKQIRSLKRKLNTVLTKQHPRLKK